MQHFKTCADFDQTEAATVQSTEPERPLAIRTKSVPDTLISPSTAPNILNLPTELYTQILSYVDFADLASFRLCCRTSHAMLYSGDILRHWIVASLPPHLVFLHPPPSPPTFVYVLEQHRRKCAVEQTATVLVEYIEHEILKHTLRRANVDTDQYRQGLFGLVKIRLREKMTPLLFTIQRYLELKAECLLSEPPTDAADSNGDPSPAASTFLLPTEKAEHTFFTSLPPPHLLQTHKCFHFLTWLTNQILSRPSYVGTMERTMRGWLSEPLDLANFRLYFLFGGNLAALRELVSLPSYKHRRRAVEGVMRTLDPGQNVHWAEKWKGLGGKFGIVPGREKVERVLGCKVSVEDVWVRGARGVLVEKGVLKEGEESEVGSPWMTMDFLEDIAGYDILHTPPSWTTA